MSKIAFILRRRPELTPEAALAAWRSPEHTALVEKIPGLVRYVQNSVVSSPGAPVCDGIGELWFRDDTALNAALSSPEMAAASEDADPIPRHEHHGPRHPRRTRSHHLTTRNSNRTPPTAVPRHPAHRPQIPASPEPTVTSALALDAVAAGAETRRSIE